MNKMLYLSANGFPARSNEARGTFSLEHAQALRKLGVEIEAVDMSRERFEQEDVDGLQITRLPRIRRLLRHADVRGLLRYAGFFLARKADRYDAILFSFFYLKYLPLILFLRTRRRVVLVIAHGGEVMPGGLLRSWLKRWMFRSVDVVTPVSDFTEAIFSCLVCRRQSDNRKIVTIHNGIDPEKLRPTVGGKEMRRQLGLTSSEFVILSVCNLVKRKGVDILVQAISALGKEGREVHHVVIGRGPERDRLAALAAANGNGARFTFIDAVEASELANYYQMADLFALVSITNWETGQVEGFGITYVEAMAMGTPVIGGGGSGTATPIKHGFSGLLVDPYQPEIISDVAVAIRRFMDDRDFYDKVSADARRHVAEYFTWARNAERTKAVIESALRHKHCTVNQEGSRWQT